MCVADQNSAISVRWFLKSFLEEDGGGGEGQRTSVTASYGLGKCDISFSKSNTNGYKDIAFFLKKSLYSNILKCFWYPEPKDLLLKKKLEI